jgi:hypothetical protein
VILSLIKLKPYDVLSVKLVVKYKIEDTMISKRMSYISTYIEKPNNEQPIGFKTLPEIKL